MDKEPILGYHVNRVINCNCVFYDFSVGDSKKATNCNTKPFQYSDVFNESGEYNNTFFQSCLRFSKITHIAKMMIKFSCVL